MVAGGSTPPTASASVDLFDPATGAWSPGPPLPVATLPELVVLADGRVAAVGGDTTFPAATAAISIFDPYAGVWLDGGTLPLPRAGHQAVLMDDGAVFVIGGANTTTGNASGGAFRFDPVSGAVTDAGTNLTPRAFHAASVLRPGHVVLAGGDNASMVSINDVLARDPATGSFNLLGRMTQGRTRLHLVQLVSGDLFLHGDSNGASAERFRVSDGTAYLTQNGVDATYSSRTVLLADGDVLVTGGIGSSGHTALSWRYREGYSRARPPPRIACAVVWPGATVQVDGQLFGDSEGHGGTAPASENNHAIFRLSMLDGSRASYLDTRYFSRNVATFYVPPSTVPGWYEVRSIINGVPSVAVPLRIAFPAGAACVSNVQCGTGVCQNGFCAAGSCVLRAVPATDGGTDAGTAVDAGADGGLSADGGDDAGSGADADGGNDAGTASADGGQAERLVLDVGCGCAHGPSVLFAALAVAAAAIRRRARTKTPGMKREHTGATFRRVCP